MKAIAGTLCASWTLIAGSAMAQGPTWAKRAVPLTLDCTAPALAPVQRVVSPNHGASLQAGCRRSASDDEAVAWRLSGPNGAASALALNVSDDWRPKEVMWSKDSKAFLINGAETSYSGDAFVVYRMESGEPMPVDGMRSVQRDMVERYPLCSASVRRVTSCTRLPDASVINVAAIAWIGGSRGLAVMAETPCSASYGDNMCQMVGYELDARTGRILRTMNARQLRHHGFPQIDSRFSQIAPANR